MVYDLKYKDFAKRNSISGYPNWDMLGELLAEVKPKIVVEVGTYYGGWTKFIEEFSDLDTIVFTFQTPNSDKLNHLEDTSKGEHNIVPDFVMKKLQKDFPNTWGKSTVQNWKDLTKKTIDKKYHKMYDFNLLAENMNNNKKAVCILETSPPKFKWPIQYDLCTINLSYDLQDNIRQVNYWIKYIKKSGILCITSYGTVDELNNIFSKKYKTKIYNHGYLWIYGNSKV